MGLAIALLLLQIYRGRGSAARADGKAAAELPSALEVSSKSVAVLPFENLSHDPDNAYFADGIQEEILTRLAKIADLKVISRTSTQHYKSAPENLPEVWKSKSSPPNRQTILKPTMPTCVGWLIH